MKNPKVRIAKTAYQVTIALALLSSLALISTGPIAAQNLANQD
jgi:hypothetical protein